MSPLLEYEQVTRRFGRTPAIDDLSLRVEPGTVLGMVGRNGAGKTTALRLATGYLHPDTGRVRVVGLDPVTQGLDVRLRVSLLSEESSLYPWMTVGEILAFGEGLHPRWDRAFAEALRRRLDLDGGRRVGALSRGTRAKVALLLAVATRPDLLLLDDPTSGLDPLVRREVLQTLLEAVPESGGAVVYASHLVQDIERVADRVAVLDGGKLVLEGSLEEIKEGIVRATAVFEGEAPAGGAVPGCVAWSATGRVLIVIAEGGEPSIAASLRSLGARAVEAEGLSLEDIVIAYLERGRGLALDSAVRPDTLEVLHG